jgi:hypothetical protein
VGLDFYTAGTAAFVTLLLFQDFQHDSSNSVLSPDEFNPMSRGQSKLSYFETWHRLLLSGNLSPTVHYFTYKPVSSDSWTIHPPCRMLPNMARKSAAASLQVLGLILELLNNNGWQ